MFDRLHGAPTLPQKQAVPNPLAGFNLVWWAQAVGAVSMTSDEPRAISVLLIEDDAPTLWRLQDTMSKAGYRVRAQTRLP